MINLLKFTPIYSCFNIVSKVERIVDPPSGWLYGFPKVMPDGLDTEEKRIQWFLDNGYPQREIDMGSLNHCRFWYATAN